MTSMNENVSTTVPKTPAAHFSTECSLTSRFRRREREVPSILEFLPASDLERWTKQMPAADSAGCGGLHRKKDARAEGSA